MTKLAISDWRLVGLTADKIGPFQSRSEFTFMSDAPAGPDGESAGPTNLYMLLARNGRGKTTLLETIHGLFGLLSYPPQGRFVDPRAPGEAQLDIRATWTIDGVTRTVLLSIWTGSTEPLKPWSADELEEKAQATEWAKLGLLRSYGVVTGYDASNDLGLTLFRAIRENAGRASGSVFGETLDLPTVLLFPADRMLVVPTDQRIIEEPDNWRYQPAHAFGTDGVTWNGSIDNLIAWLTWLQDGQLETLTRFVNEKVFPHDQKTLLPMERSELTSYVSTPDGNHPLSALSHGERALLQLFLRVAAHMTRNTVILIDEIETHLHTRWMNRMFQALKELLRTLPSLSIVFTTHNRELIQVFDFQRQETGIVKGGYLITEDMG